MSFAGFFLKFGKAQHIIDLQQRGRLFLNPISYFSKIEDGNLRGDKLEDVIQINFIGDARIDLKPVDAPDSEYKSMNAFNVTEFLRPTNPLGNLFCVYAINVSTEPINKKINIEKRVLEFGNYCLFISDPHEFIKRVRQSLVQAKVKFADGMVNYLDLSKHKGRKTVFQKDLIYNYQQEYRVFVDSVEDKPMTFEIGDLSDISFICHTKHIGEMEISVKEKNEEEVRVLHNLSFAPATIFLPNLTPQSFIQTFNGVEFSFELQTDEIEPVFVVTAGDNAFKIIISESNEWIIKGEVPRWIRDLEDELGIAINNAMRAA